MRSVTLIVPLACVARAAHHVGEAQDSLDKLVDKLVDDMRHRAHEVSPILAELDMTTLEKPGSLAIPAHASSLTSLLPLGARPRSNAGAQLQSSSVAALPENMRSWVGTLCGTKQAPKNHESPVTQAVSSRRALLAIAGLCTSALQQPVWAETVFSGVYADPNHPMCDRTIDDNGVIRGVDPVPFARGSGCKPGISASPWKIQGKVSSDDKSIFINFDEKDGSGEAFDGVFDNKRNGLLLPDGTLWKKVGPYKLTSPIPGDYDDSSHPGCKRRVLPTGKVQGEDPPGLLTPGSKCMPGDKTTPWELDGSIVGNQLVINFDPIDEVKQGPILAVYKDNSLRTANGVWKKQ